MESIKSKILLIIGILLFIIFTSFSLISYSIAVNALKSNLSKTLPGIAEQVAGRIEESVNVILSSLEVISAREDIKDLNNSLDNKLIILNEEVKRNSYIKIGIANLNGDIKFTDGKKSNVMEIG